MPKLWRLCQNKIILMNGFVLSPDIASKSFRRLLYLWKFFTSTIWNAFGIWILNGPWQYFCFVLPNLKVLCHLIQHSICWPTRVFFLWPLSPFALVSQGDKITDIVYSKQKWHPQTKAFLSHNINLKYRITFSYLTWSNALKPKTKLQLNYFSDLP